MGKVIEIAALVLVPLIWGLAVEFAFELVRQRRNRSREDQAE